MHHALLIVTQVKEFAVAMAIVDFSRQQSAPRAVVIDSATASSTSVTFAANTVAQSVVPSQPLSQIQLQVLMTDCL